MENIQMYAKQSYSFALVRLYKQLGDAEFIKIQKVWLI